MTRRKIMFLARELSFGGAERQMIVLARGLAAANWDVVIATFYDRGAMESELRETGVRLVSVRKTGRWDLVAFARSLRDLVIAESPDILHSYLDAPNAVAAVSRAVGIFPPVVWGVRASGMDWSGYDWMRRATFEVTRALSRVPALIISNSEAGRQYCLAKGYPAPRTVVIPNGIDTDAFRPDSVARARIRGEWGTPADARLMGIVGRLDPMKGHRTFLRAAKRVSTRPDVRFVIIGSGDSTYAKSLRREVDESEPLRDRVLWVPARSDAPAILNALDAVVMSSEWGEGFPNVLAEAMACGTPCVATDCGDSAVILAGNGEAVPVGDAESLAQRASAALAMTGNERHAWGSMARDSIVDRFSIDRLVTSTSAVLEHVLRDARPVSARPGRET